MEKPDYCTRESVETCLECSLTSYNRDCMNNPVRYPDDDPDHPPPDPYQFVSDSGTIRYTEPKQSETILEIERRA